MIEAGNRRSPQSFAEAFGARVSAGLRSAVFKRLLRLLLIPVFLFIAYFFTSGSYGIEDTGGIGRDPFDYLNTVMILSLISAALIVAAFLLIVLYSLFPIRKRSSF